MRFIQTHSMGSDCTVPYDIVDYQAKTAVEFINEMLQQCKSEWGDIEVWTDNKPLGYKCINYKRGELLDEIPDAWQYKKVTKVIAAGGWGRMDYRIYVKAKETMNDFFFDNTRHDQVQKDEMEILDRKKHELKLIGRQRKVPGHTLFSFNLKTGEIKKAPVEHSKSIDYKTREPLYHDRIVIEPDCLYRQALNKKNFIKRLIREGIIIK